MVWINNTPERYHKNLIALLAVLFSNQSTYSVNKFKAFKYDAEKVTECVNASPTLATFCTNVLPAPYRVVYTATIEQFSMFVSIFLK
jgi:hypothetical protein